MNFIKRFFESKMLRLALFIFMFFFIFKIIDHILIFFNINQEMGYIYFMWFTVLFLLFVLLPIDRSYFKIFNKVTTPTPPKSNSSGVTSVVNDGIHHDRTSIHPTKLKDNFVNDLKNLGLEQLVGTFENRGMINDISDLQKLNNDQLKGLFSLNDEQIENVRKFRPIMEGDEEEDDDFFSQYLTYPTE